MMILGSMSALAANTQIKIGDVETGYPANSDNKTPTLENHKFKAYEILKADGATSQTGGVEFTNLQWGDAVTPASLLTALQADTTIGAHFSNFAPTGADTWTAAAFGKAIEGFTSEEAKALAQVLKANVTGGIEVNYGTATDLTNPGYYLVDDVTVLPAGSNDAMNPVVLFAFSNTVNAIKIKAEYPTVEKKIDGSKDDDSKTSGLVDKDTVSIGDDVPYVITSKVPNMDFYKEYYMEFSDTLSYGLTYNNDLRVEIGGTDYTSSFTNTITPETKNVAAKQPTSISVKIADLKKLCADNNIAAGTEIKVTYSAIVNETAKIGEEGNPNTVKLIFSNDPDHSGDGNPDTPDDDNVHGETPEDVVITYVTQIKVLKQDGKTSAALEGAVFTLTGTKVKTVLIAGEFFDEDATGTYYKLNDGTYTQTVATSQTESQYASTTIKYKKTTYTAATPKKVETTEQVKAEAISGADGYLEFTGLSEGEYTFTEVQAPTGYNKIDPITLTISYTTPNSEAMTTSDKVTWSCTASDSTSVQWDAADQALKFIVNNNSGAILPSTGGIGTTIFYVAGSLMVLAAAILLVTKRRMGAND